MIFNLLFKKRLKKINTKQIELEILEKRLIRENEDLKLRFEFEQDRFEKTKELLNNKIRPKSICFLETTDCGVNVLVAIYEKENEIEIFNIDSRHKTSQELGVWIKIWTKTRRKQIFIKEEKGTERMGFLTTALKYAMKYVDEKDLDQITEKINFEQADRKQLINLLERMKFELKYFSN